MSLVRVFGAICTDEACQGIHIGPWVTAAREDNRSQLLVNTISDEHAELLSAAVRDLVDRLTTRPGEFVLKTDDPFAGKGGNMSRVVIFNLFYKSP